MSNLFNSVSARRPKRNVFNLSHSVKMSTQMGRLTPILCEEVVPGDKFRGNTNALVRLAPMLAPVMQEINVYTHFFFVPNRLLWNEWEDFITGGRDGTSSPVFPRFRLTGNELITQMGNRSLADYLGVSYGQPTASTNTVDISQLPFRAYQLIYNEYYRDQNLQDEIDIPLESGISVGPIESLLSLRNRAWEKDYFTSALPWAQRGPEVRFPLGGDARVRLDVKQPGDRQWVVDPNTGNPVYGDLLSYQSPTPQPGILSVGDGTTAGSSPAVIDPNGTLWTDLSEVSGTSVNEFRRSIRIQEWLEKNARGGSRYIEQILSHFGVRSSDARLQRPEFLGGGKSPIIISEVLQTSSSDETSPQANMSGHGISAHGSHAWSKYIEEHGYIIGIMSILPRTAYQQGLPKHFAKFDKFDFYWPELAHLGEQPIWNKEIYLDPSSTSDENDAVFGYTPRYAEYKYCSSRVHGDFKDTLAFWHQGRIFSSKPNLNEQFVISDPTERIFAVDDTGSTDKLWVQLHNIVHAVRPMPKYGTPTI